MLDAGVILETVAREVLAVATALESTVRHLCHKWNMGVYPDASEVKGLGHPHCSSMIFGPDR